MILQLVFILYYESLADDLGDIQDEQCTPPRSPYESSTELFCSSSDNEFAIIPMSSIKLFIVYLPVFSYDTIAEDLKICVCLECKCRDSGGHIGRYKNIKHEY